MKGSQPAPATPEWLRREVNESQAGGYLSFQVTPSAQFYQPFNFEAWDPNVVVVVDGVYNRMEEEGAGAALRQVASVEEHLRAFFGYTKRLDELCEQVKGLESKVEQVLKKLGEVGALRQSFLVPIESLAPEPYELMKPFTAVVIEAEGEFEAAIFDLGIFASGGTEEEAIANLKETLLDTVDRLNELPDTKLGKGPLRQKNLLNKWIRKVEKG
jgi:predicted RNase H-like HicB family nuclease